MLHRRGSRHRGRLVDELEPAIDADKGEQPVDLSGVAADEQPAIRLTRPAVGREQQVHTARVDELKLAQVEHHDPGVRLSVAQRQVKLGDGSQSNSPATATRTVPAVSKRRHENREKSRALVGSGAAIATLDI